MVGGAEECGRGMGGWRGVGGLEECSGRVSCVQGLLNTRCAFRRRYSLQLACGKE